MANTAWWVITKREFSTRVRSKWFIITTLLGPVMLIGLIVVPALIAKKAGKKAVRIDIIAHCEKSLAQSIGQSLKLTNPTLSFEFVDPTTPEEESLARLRDEKIDGYLVLPKGMLEGKRPKYSGANATNFQFVRRMTAGISRAVIATRAEQLGISAEQANKLAVSTFIDTELTTGKKKGTSGFASFILGYIVAMLLYMSILIYAVNVMRSVLEEKTNRVVELIASSTPSSHLMAGKIGGVGSVGLLQLGIWTAVAGIAFRYCASLLGSFGLPDNMPFELPAPGLATIAVILIYFLLGFFFFASIYAAVGAMCSTDQEAQQVQIPIVMLLIIPVMCLQVVANDPRGELTSLLTQIPFASPILMPMRYLLGGATLGDVALSVAILIASLGVVVLLAGRVYRVGILMYGKRPSVRELVRWIRYS